MPSAQSAKPFDAFNLGDHVGDAPAAVAANRALLAQSIAAKPVFLKQIHGFEVQTLSQHSPNGKGDIVADACITRERGVACTIMVADCLPVLFTDKKGSFVAAAHAGWRGLAGEGAGEGADGVLEAVFKEILHNVTVISSYSAIKSIPIDVQHVADHLLVWLGPCIGPEAFEVGPEVRQAFVDNTAQAAQHFKAQPDGKYLCNLAALARQRLAAMGITNIYGNDSSAPWCTVGNPAEYFSHRRDAKVLGSTGRMAGCVWMV
jgi:polyphenol oxidase